MEKNDTSSLEERPGNGAAYHRETYQVMFFFLLPVRLVFLLVGCRACRYTHTGTHINCIFLYFPARISPSVSFQYSRDDSVPFLSMEGLGRRSS